MTARHWCFTLNNPTEQIDPSQDERVRYCIWQEEAAPDTGTRHYQGYVEFSSPVRRGSLGRWLRGGHFERRRGTREQAREYCRKPDRLDGPWEYGEWSSGGQGKRNELAEALVVLGRRNRSVDVADEFPGVYVKFHRGLQALSIARHSRKRRRVKCYGLIGPPGIGKTRYVFDMWGHDLYVLAQQKPLWFDGYAGEDVLLIDELHLEFNREWLLRILDIYPMNVPVKGGFVPANWTKVYITCNHDFYTGWDAALQRRMAHVDYLT